MNWLTTLAFAGLLLSVQYEAVQSASPSRSPWANPAQASSLMNCLITKIAGSNVLPQQEKEDLGDIVDTLMSAINGASAKGKSSGAQLQAINMAVASSLAELVVAEDAGNQASIAVKTQALSGALEQCFQAVMGTVDRKFINEINDLIRMFAREAASEANEIQDQGASYAAGSSASSSFQATSQNFQGSSQTAGGFGTYSGGAYPGIQVAQPAPIQTRPLVSQPIPQVSQPTSVGYTGGAAQFGTVSGQTSFGQASGSNSFAGSQGGIGQISGAQAGLISRISNALANTSTMKTVLRSNISTQTITNVVQRTVQTLARTLGVDGNNLSRIALQAISQIPAGSDTSAYTQALSTALITGGVLNESNINTVGSQVLSAVLNGLSSAAQGLGINVDTGSVQNDIRSSSGFLASSSSSTSFSQTAASTSGAASTTGFTGPSGPAPSYGGSAQLGSVSGQTSFGQTSGQASYGQTSGQASYGQTSGSASFGGSQGGIGGASVSGGAQAGLISQVANALANTSTLRAVFGSGTSSQTAASMVQRAAQSLASSLGVDGNNLARIAVQAVSQVPAGAGTSAYAQALSTALFNAGVLNASNINSIGSQVMSAVLNGVSSAAQGMGISVDTGSVQNDIRSSSGFLASSSSSTSFAQTAAATSGAASTTGFTGPSGPAPSYGGSAQVGSVSGQTSFGQTSGQASYGQTSGSASFAGSQGAFGQTSGSLSSGIIQGGFGQVSGTASSGSGQSAGVSLRSALNAPNGLRSGSAAARVNQLTSSIGNAVGPNGVDANGLARSLQASFSSLRSSGMSASDAKVEVLLETIVGLLQLLSNTQIRGVNAATASSVANSAARSFELVLA